MPQLNKISKNNTKIYSQNGATTVVLHNTPIMCIDYMFKEITFNNGGYVTATTTNRMNQVCNEYNLPYRVFRKQGTMYITDIKTGNSHEMLENSIVVPLGE